MPESLHRHLGCRHQRSGQPGLPRCGKCVIRMHGIGITKPMTPRRSTPAQHPDILELSRLTLAVQFRPGCQTGLDCRLRVGEGQSPPGKHRADDLFNQSLVLLDKIASRNQAILENADTLVRRPQETEFPLTRQCSLKQVQLMIAGHLGAIGLA